MILKFLQCGHIGRMNRSYRAKAMAFIRVAEIRDERVMPVDSRCPDCKRGRDSYV
jgi:hypothetical protein